MGQKADVAARDSHAIQRRNAEESHPHKSQTQRFVDNRSLSTAQRILIDRQQSSESSTTNSFSGNSAQRVEDEEMLQGKFAVAQRNPEEDEEPVQGKFTTVQRSAMEEEELVQGKSASDSSASQIQAQLKPTSEPSENQTGLPDNLKAGIESLSGMDVSDVRVHRNSGKPAQLNAHAYAQGNDIHVGPGQEQHLPHEAWHVVQQRQGRVKPNLQMGGVNINDDNSLEKEADTKGGQAMSVGQRVVQRAADYLGVDRNGKGVQCKADGDVLYNGESVMVHDANPVMQMFLKKLFGNAKATMLTIEAVGHVVAGIALMIAGGATIATPLGVATFLAGACQAAIAISKCIRAYLMSKDAKKYAGWLGGLISFEALLWAGCTPAAFIAGGALAIGAGIVSAVGALTKLIRGILSGLGKLSSKVKGVLIVIEAICGLFGSAAGLIGKGFTVVAKGIANVAAGVVNLVKGVRGIVTRADKDQEVNENTSLLNNEN